MTKRVVLIGHPVAHSLSGAMQQAAFDSLGIDAKYELWDRAPIDLADAIAELHGDANLRGAPTDSLDDHRLAMTFAIAGLLAAGATTVERPGSAAISYPGFFDDLERVRA